MHPTCFTELLGNEEVKRQLESMLSKKAVGHALLFTGPEGIGKSLFAWGLAARLLKEYDPEKDHGRKIAAGQHPDIHIYRPEGKLGLHSIESLRQLGDEVHLPPFEASWKIFIIHDADRMLSYSANALLKTFEEPPPRTLIILLSRSQASLLPTVLSRCSTVHFQAISSSLIQSFLERNYQLEPSVCSKIVHEAQGSLGRAVKLAERGNAARTILLNLLASSPMLDYRNLQEGIQTIAQEIESAKKLAEEKSRGELSSISSEFMSAQQQHALEKEMEGLTALAQAQEAQSLFEAILSWHRDMQLILLGGPFSRLANPDFEWALEQAVQRGGFLPLDRVYAYVEEAYLSLQRSTSLSLCLENLFLKIIPL